MKVTLTDTYGESSCFEYSKDADGKLQSKIVYESEEFGEGHTDYAEINDIDITGNMCRFFEGMLGIESLYDVLNDPELGSYFINEFKPVCALTKNDYEALEKWGKAILRAKKDAVFS